MNDSPDNLDASLPDAAPLRRRPLPMRKKLAYSLAATLLFFVLLECALALVGVAATIDLSDPFVGFEGSSPLFVPDEASDDSSQMITAKNKLAWFNEQSFSRSKPPDVRRVFCLGGSTTYGRPYDDTTSFAGWLRELLPIAAPEDKWEVINAGGVSYASYRVARVTQELLQYEPDLFIVYTGHNEFLEERTYGEIKRASALRSFLVSSIAQTRTGTLARQLLVGQRDEQHDGRFHFSDDVDTVLDHTVGPTTYRRDVEQRRRIVGHFEANLARIVTMTRTAGVPVVLVTPASNLKDSLPFKSQHSDELSDKTLHEWTRQFEKARRLEQDGDPAVALAAYRRAADLDPQFAEVHWRTGRVLLQLEQFDQAHAAFWMAVDEDVCPLRAVSEISQVVRRTAERLNVPLVDFEQLVAEQCRQQLGHSSAGRDLFLDHVHPTIATNGQLAAAIVEKLSDAGIIDVDSALTTQQIVDTARQIDSRIDARQHAIALRNLAKVLNWAGKHREAGSLAMRAVEQLPDDPESLVLSAAYLSETGRVEKAIEHYRRALQHRPDYATAHQMLGAALVDRGELNEALTHFAEFTRLRPDDSHAWQLIGAIHVEQQHFEKALANLETALTLNPDDANIHYNLANALGHLGRRQEAIRHYSRAVELNPEDADARNNLGVMLLQNGQLIEAASQFREVLRIRPDDTVAAANLRDAQNVNRSADSR